MSVLFGGKTPISVLQELMAARKLQLPVYIEETEGLTFKCTVEAAGVVGIGHGPTKKTAKHNSALSCLQKLQNISKNGPQSVIIEKSPPLIPAPAENKTQKNYVGELNEFASKNGLTYPEYQEIVHFDFGGKFYCKCSFIGKEETGVGVNKKDAKQCAAKKMLDLVTILNVNTLVLDGKYKLLPCTKSTTSVPNRDDVLAMYKVLSVKDDPKVLQDERHYLNPSPSIVLDEEETILFLQAKLKSSGVDYSLEEICSKPYIMKLTIKDTHLCFLGCENTKEAATRRVLKTALQVKRDGCSLNTDDLISFD